MSEDSANPFDAIANDEDPTPAPVGFPRLRVIHLMAWMAATAVAFLPYQMQRQAQIRLSPGAAVTSQTITATTMGMAWGVAAGGYLFVTIAVLYWRRTGRVEPLQPGHWLAFEGVGRWMMGAVVILLLFSSEGSAVTYYQWLAIPQLLIGVLFFICLLWLATRRLEPPRWRWTFAVMAVAPLATWLLTVAAAFSGWFRGQMTSYFVLHAVTGAVQGIVLLAAMAGDLTTRKQRHWSHWLGAGMRLAVLAATAAMYSYYFVFPRALTGG